MFLALGAISECAIATVRAGFPGLNAFGREAKCGSRVALYTDALRILWKTSQRLACHLMPIRFLAFLVDVAVPVTMIFASTGQGRGEGGVGQAEH